MNSEDNNLPLNIQYIIRLCKQIIQDARSGKCTEEEVNNIISCVNAKENGYINPKDYLSAEDAMKELGMHRKQFFEYLKLYDIKCYKINNQPIGYHINDLNKLRGIIK